MGLHVARFERPSTHRFSSASLTCPHHTSSFSNQCPTQTDCLNLSITNKHNSKGLYSIILWNIFKAIAIWSSFISIFPIKSSSLPLHLRTSPVIISSTLASLNCSTSPSAQLAKVVIYFRLHFHAILQSAPLLITTAETYLSSCRLFLVPSSALVLSPTCNH